MIGFAHGFVNSFSRPWLAGTAKERVCGISVTLFAGDLSLGPGDLLTEFADIGCEFVDSPGIENRVFEAGPFTGYVVFVVDHQFTMISRPLC
jgi:hypothetical protein